MAVVELPLDVFDNRGDPAGQRNAMLSRLEDIERTIEEGDIEQSIRMLENLRRRLDGCLDTPIAGEMADNNDWVLDCGAQRDLRTLIDVLISNLGG